MHVPYSLLITIEYVYVVYWFSLYACWISCNRLAACFLCRERIHIHLRMIRLDRNVPHRYYCPVLFARFARAFVIVAVAAVFTFVCAVHTSDSSNRRRRRPQRRWSSDWIREQVLKRPLLEIRRHTNSLPFSSTADCFSTCAIDNDLKMRRCDAVLVYVEITH